MTAGLRQYIPQMIQNAHSTCLLLFNIYASEIHGMHTTESLLVQHNGHSTETAVLRVLSDLLEAVDDGDIAALALLDLSAGFDSVDHSILCKRLRLTFGLDGQVLEWFRSYLHGRSQYVRRGMLKSLSVLLVCGVPQGSVLGPILFILLYTAELIGLIEQHGFCPHLLC